MTIKEAIKEAKKAGKWNDAGNGPTSVAVNFIDVDGDPEETELLLESRDKETELETLWESLCEEMNSDVGYIISVEAYGYPSDDYWEDLPFL